MLVKGAPGHREIALADIDKLDGYVTTTNIVKYQTVYIFLGKYHAYVWFQGHVHTYEYHNKVS